MLCSFFFRSKMSLELRKDTVTLYNLSQRINCTTALFSVPSVLIPQSSAVCKMKTDQKSNWIVVNGLDLHAGRMYLISFKFHVTLQQTGNLCRVYPTFAWDRLHQLHSENG